MTSSKFAGFNSFMKFFIPALSSWKTPSVFPVARDANTALSSKSIWSISIAFPLLFSAIRTAFWITVRVLNPRKSIFNRPSSSIVVIVNCVVIIPSEPRESGTYSSIGFCEITTPAACMDVWRGRPSRRLDISISCFTDSSVS